MGVGAELLVELCLLKKLLVLDAVALLLGAAAGVELLSLLNSFIAFVCFVWAGCAEK